jgi:hypothetical protein
VPEEPNPSGDKGSDEYHRKSAIEKYIADPIRALTDKVKRLSDRIASDAHTTNEKQDRDYAAAQARHEKQLIQQKATVTWQKRGVMIGGFLSSLTLAVLIGTLYIYSEQADIMRETSRAVIVAGPPDLDTIAGLITFAVSNIGRTPSPKISLIVYEARMPAPSNGQPPQECHTSNFTVQNLAPGPYIWTAIITLPKWTQVEASKLSVTIGESIILAGDATYDDGFGTTNRPYTFCLVSRYQLTAKKLIWTPCPEKAFDVIRLAHCPPGQE